MVDVVQYLIVRGDLIKSLKWPVGAVIAQACHASSAAIHLFYSDQHTTQYLEKLDSMHKVVLEAGSQEALEELSSKLRQDNISHKLWMEQPENIPTCIALKPYPKLQVQSYFKHLKLFK